MAYLSIVCNASLIKSKVTGQVEDTKEEVAKEIKNIQLRCETNLIDGSGPSVGPSAFC